MADECDASTFHSLATTVNNSTLQLIEDQRGIHTTTAKITQLLSQRGCLHDDVASLLSGIKDGVLRTLNTASGLYDVVPPLLQRSEAAEELAQRVFDVPELLEIMLLELNNADLLKAMQVSKQWFASIEGSVKLQRKLGLLADHDCNFRLPVPDGSLSIEVDEHITARCASKRNRSASPALPTTYEVILCSGDIARDVGRRVGRRVRSMLVCQPPITQMSILPICCGSSRGHGVLPPLSPVANAAGITIGHLLDAVAVTAEEHKTCPHAEIRCHMPDGYVDVRSAFEGAIEIRQDDPAVHAYRPWRETTQKRSNRSPKQDAWYAKIEAYTDTKLRAYNNGEKIPTLAEWDEQYEMVEDDGDVDVAEESVEHGHDD